MRPVGLSTGAIARGDFRGALEARRHTDADAVELSALRTGELPTLIAALPDLRLSGFRHVAVHAPSQYERADEHTIVHLLATAAAHGFDVVTHPDAIADEPRAARDLFDPALAPA